jgi:hypothetical protein
MYPRQFRTLSLFVLACLVLAPVGQAMGQSIGAQAAVTLPIAGTVINAATTQSIGQFNGTFTINSFARTSVNQIVAVGMIRGAITNPAGQILQTGLQRIQLPVALSSLTAVKLDTPAPAGMRVIPVSFTKAGGARFTRVQFGSCGGNLRVAIGGAAAVNVMGTSVMLSPVALDIASDAGGTVGGLVCQILGLLGGLLDVVPLLNSLLGPLTGLLGGATGGLLGGIL